MKEKDFLDRVLEHPLYLNITCVEWIWIFIIIFLGLIIFIDIINELRRKK